MADDYGKGRTTTGQKKKPKKKFVGLVAKAKRRKQVSESRLAQRTGKSALEHKFSKFLQRMKDRKYSQITRTPRTIETSHKTLSDSDWKKIFGSGGRTISDQDVKNYLKLKAKKQGLSIYGGKKGGKA